MFEAEIASRLAKFRLAEEASWRSKSARNRLRLLRGEVGLMLAQHGQLPGSKSPSPPKSKGSKPKWLPDWAQLRPAEESWRPTKCHNQMGVAIFGLSGDNFFSNQKLNLSRGYCTERRRIAMASEGSAD